MNDALAVVAGVGAMLAVYLVFAVAVALFARRR